MFYQYIFFASSLATEQVITTEKNFWDAISIPEIVEARKWVRAETDKKDITLTHGSARVF